MKKYLPYIIVAILIVIAILYFGILSQKDSDLIDAETHESHHSEEEVQ